MTAKRWIMVGELVFVVAAILSFDAVSPWPFLSWQHWAGIAACGIVGGAAGKHIVGQWLDGGRE